MLWSVLISTYVSKDNGKTEERKVEELGFVAGQSALGCCAYSWLAGMTVGGTAGCCVGMATPLACMSLSAAYATTVGVKPYGALASFTGGVDGLLWGFLTLSTLEANGVNVPGALSTGIPLATSLILNGGWMAYSQVGRSSEGAYLTKTLFAFQTPYYYLQLKRLALGDYVRFDSSGNLVGEDLKRDLTAITGVSVAGGLGGFLLTSRWEGYTAGDALFLSSNISKGSLVLSNLVRTAYLQTFWSQDRWESEQWKYYVALVSGYYPGSSTMNRLGSFAQLAGGVAGGVLSYHLIKRRHMSLLGGLLYSTVPAFAYWAAWAPAILFERDPRPYTSFMPLVQIALDLGTSYLIYRLTTK